MSVFRTTLPFREVEVEVGHGIVTETVREGVVGVVRPHHPLDVEVQIAAVLILCGVFELEVERAPVLEGGELDLAHRTLVDGVVLGRHVGRIRDIGEESADLDGSLGLGCRFAFVCRHREREGGEKRGQHEEFDRFHAFLLPHRTMPKPAPARVWAGRSVPWICEWH